MQTAILFEILSMKEKVQKLECEPDYDFVLYAVVASLKDYTLASELNASLEVDFWKMDDLVLNLKKVGIRYISNFRHESKHSYWSILRNQLYDELGEGNGLLIPEYKKYNYFIKIEGESAEETSRDLPKTLKSLPCVQHFKKVENQELLGLNSKDNLLF